MKQRILRVNELIRQAISEILQRDLSTQRFGIVSVTEVRASNDLHHAKIFFSVYGANPQREKAIHWLQMKTGAIQSELGSKVRLRYTPSIQFILDETEDKLNHIAELFKKI